MWRRSVVERFCADDAPSRRPRPSPAALASLSLRRSMRSRSPRASSGTCASASFFGERPLACEWPAKVCLCRIPSPHQNASKISSKRSQSECVAQNSARNAGISDAARAAAGEASTESASPVSASPTRKPLSLKVRAKSSAAGGAAPDNHRGPATRDGRRPSRYLAEEPFAHLTRDAGAVLMGLQQTNHGFIDRFRLLPQIVDFQAGKRRRPIERFGDARHLAQILLAHLPPPCGRSATPASSRFRACASG